MWIERAEKLLRLVNAKEAPSDIKDAASCAVQSFRSAQAYRVAGNKGDATSAHRKGVSAYSKAESWESLNGVVKAEFTLLLDHDGYWLVDKSHAAAVIANPDPFRNGAIKTGSKIASCRLALEKAVAMGATELHIDGQATNGIAKEIRACGIKPFIYHWNALAVLTGHTPYGNPPR